MSHLIQADNLVGGGRHHANDDIPGSGRSGTMGGFEQSTKLASRLEKLAYRRIDPSRIKFPEDVREFSGGHATVSKASMNFRWSKPNGSIRYRFPTLQQVAVKKMRIADDTDLERALGLAVREIEFLEGLDHPNIVEFQGFVEEVSKGIIWVVFAWAANGNLRDFVGSIEWEIPERISLINDVVQGLAYIHNQQPPICHGDLKSLNVLVSWKRRAAITDFGSARRVSRNGPDAEMKHVGSQSGSTQPLNATFCTFTNTITLTGNKYTLRWAAPELLMEDQLSLWGDIWALGWIAWEVMTNSIPFEDASTDIIVVERVLKGELPSLTQIAHFSFIHELCLLMNMCWRYEPIERPTANYCRESIEKMPMFVPEVDPDGRPARSFPIHRLRELGNFYQSRGEYEKAFDFFSKALEASRKQGSQEILPSLRNLAQLHRLREEYSEAIALYSEIETYSTRAVEGVASDLCNLAQLHRLRNEYNKAMELNSQGRDIQEEERLSKALWSLAEVFWRQKEYWRVVELYNEVLEIRTDLGDSKGRAEALLGLADTHRTRGQSDKAISLYSEASEIHTSLGDTKSRADVLCKIADMHRAGRKYGKAIPLYSQVLEIRTSLGDKNGRAGALSCLADMHLDRHEYDRAIPLYSEAMELCPTLHDTKGKTDALWGLAGVNRLRGEYDEAARLYSEGLEISTSLGNDRDKADALWHLAEIHRLRSDYDVAISLYSEALEIRTHIGDKKGKAHVLWGLAEVHRLRSEYDKANQLYSETLRIRASLGDEGGEADPLLDPADVHQPRSGYSKAMDIGTGPEAEKLWAIALWRQAESHRRRDEYRKAIGLYSRVVEIRADVGDTDGKAEALTRLADIHQLLSESDKDIRLYLQAVKLCHSKGRVDLLLDLADVHRLQSEYKEAIPLYLAALRIGTSQNDKKGGADALLRLADVNRLRSEHDEAIPLYSEALGICASLGDKKGGADALLGLADVHQHRSEYEKAIPLYSEAWGICTRLGDQKGKTDSLWGLAEVHRLRSEYGKAIPLYYGLIKIGTDSAQSKSRANALLRFADVFRHQGNCYEAIRLYVEALGICTLLNDRKGRADALWSLADLHRLRSEYGTANALYYAALRLHTSLGDSRDRADALLSLATLRRHQGMHDEAIPLYYEALKIRTSLGDENGRADVLLGLAEVHRLQCEYAKAIPFYSQVLEIRTDLGKSKGKNDALSGLADVHEHPGNKVTAHALWGSVDQQRYQTKYQGGIWLYSRVLKTCTSFWDSKSRAEALWGLAEVHRLQSEYDKAIPLYSQVLEICTDLDKTRGRANALSSLADVHLHRGEYEKATLDSAASRIRAYLNNEGRADVLWGPTNQHSYRRQDDQDIWLYSGVSEIFTSFCDDRGREEAFRGLAEVHWHWEVYRGDCLPDSPASGVHAHGTDSQGIAGVRELLSMLHKATDPFADPLQIRTDLGNHKGRADTHRDLPYMLWTSDRYTKAMRLYLDAYSEA